MPMMMLVASTRRSKGCREPAHGGSSWVSVVATIRNDGCLHRFHQVMVKQVDCVQVDVHRPEMSVSRQLHLGVLIDVQQKQNVFKIENIWEGQWSWQWFNVFKESIWEGQWSWQWI